MDGAWVVLLVLVGAALILAALRRGPRDDQRRIPYTPDRRAPAMPERAIEARQVQHVAPARAARPKPDIFDLRQPTLIRIVYEDAYGDDSEREVEVKSFTTSRTPPETPTHMRGQCQLRRASRAFALSRIEEAFDMRDGAEIPDVAAWLLAQPSRRRPRDLDL